MANNRFPRPEDARGPLSIIRSTIVESAANTLTSIDIETPVSPRLQVGMLLKRVAFEMSAVEVSFPAADASTQATGRATLSTKQGETDLPRLDDDGTLAVVTTNIVAGSAPADAGVALSTFIYGDQWDYGEEGLLVVTSTLTLYILSSNNKAGLVSTVRMQLGYHLVEITDTELIAALSLETGVS